MLSLGSTSEVDMKHIESRESTEQRWHSGLSTRNLAVDLAWRLTIVEAGSFAPRRQRHTVSAQTKRMSSPPTAHRQLRGWRP